MALYFICNDNSKTLFMTSIKSSSPNLFYTTKCLNSLFFNNRTLPYINPNIIADIVGTLMIKTIEYVWKNSLE